MDTTLGIDVIAVIMLHLDDKTFKAMALLSRTCLKAAQRVLLRKVGANPTEYVVTVRHRRGYVYERFKVLLLDRTTKHGSYVKLYKGKLVKKCRYYVGSLHGRYESWYDDGKPAKSCMFWHGALCGQYKSWFPNGRRRLWMTFKYCFTTDIDKWYMNGVKAREVRDNYHIKLWYEDGSPKMLQHPEGPCITCDMPDAVRNARMAKWGNTDRPAAECFPDATTTVM